MHSDTSVAVANGGLLEKAIEIKELLIRRLLGQILDILSGLIEFNLHR